MRHIGRSLLLAAGIALLLVPAATPTPALALAFTTNSFADGTDANPGNGVCETAPGNGVCTLRAAIMESNTLAGRDTITLPSGTYRLTVSGVDDAAAMGDLDIKNGEVTINGAGPTPSWTVIDASGLVTPDRVFDVQPEGIAILNQVRITGGHPMRSANGLDGGGIRVLNGGDARLTNVKVDRNQSDSAGGGIAVRANGSLRLTDSTVDNNRAISYGGGISVEDGKLTLNKSSITRNTSNKSGGGILYVGWQLSAENSTISTNTAYDTGGGMYLNLFPSPAGGSTQASYTGTYLTVANNGTSTPGTGGNIYVGLGVVQNPPRFDLRRSIVAAATQGGNCAGQPIASGGYNLEDQNVCGFTAAGDLRNTNPALQALAVDANATEVHPLPSTSPAVDVFTCTGHDQRGASRPQDGDAKPGALCDIGAYERIP